MVHRDWGFLKFYLCAIGPQSHCSTASHRYTKKTKDSFRLRMLLVIGLGYALHRMAYLVCWSD